MAKKKFQEYFDYRCTITNEKFRVTKKSSQPDELMSLNAYYEMHPDEDDRPEHIKILSKRQLESSESFEEMDDRSADSENS